MKLRLWPRRRPPEPAGETPPDGEELAEEPAPGPASPTAGEAAQQPPAPRRPGRPASAFARPYVPEEESAAPVLPAEPPATVSLTVDEAKAAIRAAGGDVIQIGFLANAYRRQREEDPAGRETAAARERLSELVARRLKDRRLLAPEGRLELLEEPPERELAG